MDAIVSQVANQLIAWGPGGVVALIAIGWGWLERRDRKDAQAKLEKALGDWKTDSQAQSDKLTAFLEKAALSSGRGR